MDVVVLDPASASDEEMVQAYEKYAAHQPGALPDLGPDPRDYLLKFWRNPMASMPCKLLVAYDGGRARAVTDARYPVLFDNLNRIDVQPAAEDQESARVLLAAVARMAQELGRTIVGAETVEGSPVSAVMTEVGASLGQREYENVLRLADAPVAKLREWAAAVPAGYSLVAWENACPEQWFDDFVTLQHTMNTAPMGTLQLEEFVRSPERAKMAEDCWVARGIEVWTLTAKHDESGHLVGFTMLEVARDRPLFAAQDDTGVLPAHRGHGLGRWLKSVNLVRLIDERPETVAVETYNAVENGPMNATNFALGHKPEFIWEMWEVDPARLV